MSLTKSLRLAGHGPFSSKTTILGLKKLTKHDDVETMSDCLVGELDLDSEFNMPTFLMMMVRFFGLR